MPWLQALNGLPLPLHESQVTWGFFPVTITLLTTIGEVESMLPGLSANTVPQCDNSCGEVAAICACTFIFKK